MSVYLFTKKKKKRNTTGSLVNTCIKEYIVEMNHNIFPNRRRLPSRRGFKAAKSIQKVAFRLDEYAYTSKYFSLQTMKSGEKWM